MPGFSGTYDCTCCDTDCDNGLTPENAPCYSGDEEGGGTDPASGQPTVGNPGIPANTGSPMPYDAGLTYDSSGNSAGGGGGPKFGDKWIAPGLAGLSDAGTAEPGYYRGPRRALEFEQTADPDKFDAKFFNLQQLGYDGTSEKFSLLDPSGMIRTFEAGGRISSVSGRCGNHTAYHYSETGRIQKVSTVFDDGTNEYLYEWDGDRIESITYRVITRDVLRAEFAYGTGGLRTVKLYENSAPSGSPDWGTPVSCSLYTYHEDSGLLRHVIPPTQYRQMVNNSIDPELAGASVLSEYASAEYEYYPGGRVKTMYKHGRRYKHDFEYHFNYPSGTDLNQWTTRTTVTLPDGTKHAYYFNRIGQWMLHKVTAPAAGGGQVWHPLYQKFEPESGRLVLSADAPAIESVNESSPGLVTLAPNAGRITVIGYNSEKRRESIGIRNGDSGTLIPLRDWEYLSRTVSGKGTIYVRSSETVYPAGDGASAVTTTFDYDWYDGSFQYKKRTTHLPVIDAAQNGRGQTLTTEAHYNSRGLLVKSVDQRQTATEYTYDETRGGMTSKTEDAGTGRLNLVTDYALDDRGRTVRELGPVHEVDIDGTPTSVRTARWTQFLDSQSARRSFAGYRTAIGEPADEIVGPVTIELFNAPPPPANGGPNPYHGYRQTAVIAAAYGGPGIPAPDHEFGRSTWLRWSLALHDMSSELREQRTYFDIPDEGYGSRSVNYARSLFGYDANGRPDKTTDPDDNIDKTTYNSMGWAVTGETGTVTGDLTLVVSRKYDIAGNLEEETRPVNGDSAADRVTEYGYDWRNRLISETRVVEKDGGGTWALITRFTYDNRDRRTSVTGYHTAVSDSNRISRQTAEYDDLGRPYRQTVRGVAENGTLTGELVSDTYYNETGQVARSAPAGSRLFTATAYDPLGRALLVSQAYEPSSSSSSSSSSGTIGPDPADLSNAIVMSQTATAWDAAGNTIASTTRERFDNAEGPGNLGDPATQPKARVSHSAAYPDTIGRTVAVADFGTNGGEAWSRPHTVPDRSDIVLVATTAFDTAGNITSRTDPAAITATSAYDDAGRLTTLVENATGGSAQRRTTRYEYTDANGLRKLVSQNPATGEQVTEWLRGVTTGLGSGINSNRLVFQKSYPDSSGESDRVTYTYNRQSEALTRTDQAGTLHTYTRDKLGRLLADLVTFPSGTALDTTVGRLTTGYNERGLVVRSTSINPAGNVVINEVRAAYNDFNQLHTEWQEHNGAVNLSTSRKVQYAYENGASNTIRPTTLTSPGGTAVTTAYQSETADALSRPDQVRENSAVLASMEFLGLATLVGLDYEAASHARLTMKDGGTGGDAGDIYTGLDRFDRLVETLWKTGSAATLVQTKYGRNRVGGVVWQRNVKAHESSAATQDQYYWYDGLRQVTRHDRGDLVPSSGGPYTGIDPATRQQQEEFHFDETGNFLTAYSQNPALSQSRSHDRANQITAISGPAGVVQPAYDPAGNMTLMPSTGDWTEGDDLVWDAWNRLVRVRPAGSSSSSSSSSSGSSSSSSSGSSSSYSSSESSSSYSSSESGSSSSDSEGHSSSGSYHSASSSSAETRGEVTYQYDALTRRTRKTNSGGTIDYYYDKQWRAIEEWTGGSVDAHYVWSPLDRWTMIRRKRGGEELYVLKDYLDPAAIIDTGGNVVERFGYDAFGPASFMAPDFTPRPSSAADWNFLFHAEFLDEDTGLYNYGYRYYNPELGRWPSRDPIGPNFITGELNDYAFIKNLGLNAIDYLGLTVISGNVDEVGGNCLGGAVMNDGGVYLQPNHKSEKNQSFKEALEKDFGLKCTEHKEAKDCNCKCNEEKILITLYKNDDPKNKGKNPWNDPKFEWNFDSKGKPLSDIHAIRADRGCDRNYKQIPRFQRGIPGQAGFNKNIDWDLFKDKPLLCCCYKKK